MFLAENRREISVGNEKRVQYQIQKLLKVFGVWSRKWRRLVEKVVVELQIYFLTVIKFKYIQKRKVKIGFIKMFIWFD